MEQLTNKQKIIFFTLIGAMIIVVGIYIFQNANSKEIYDVSENEIILSKPIEDTKENQIIVHITGCVENEGVVKLKEGARIIDAIEAAGGLTLDANIKNVNLAYIITDGQKIYIPSNIDEEEEQMQNEDSIIEESSSMNGKININTATGTELEILSGIGPSTATKIIEYRNSNGKFKSIEDIKNVPGIGDAKFNTIKDNITVK